MCARPVIGIAGDAVDLDRLHSGTCPFPLWIALVNWFHLPLRLAIELTQIGGALTLLVAFRSLGVNRWACLASFLVLCLHPIGFQENDYTMSDTFLRRDVVVCPRWFASDSRDTYRWSAAGTGIAIAILWNTREEGILVIALLGLWLASILSAGKSRREGQDDRDHHRNGDDSDHAGLRRRTIVFFVPCPLGDDGAGLSKALYHSLAADQPAEPKSTPITMETLDRAFGSAQARASYARRLDGPLGEAWRVERCGEPARLNEIGVGWIVSGDAPAASTQGIFASPKIAQAFFHSSGPRNQCSLRQWPASDPFCPRWFPRSFRAERRPSPASRLGQTRGRPGLRAVAGQTTRGRFPPNERRNHLYDEMTLRRRPGSNLGMARLHLWKGLSAATTGLLLFCCTRSPRALSSICFFPRKA